MDIDRFSHMNISVSVPAGWHYATGLFSLLCLLCGSLSNGLVIFVFIRNSNLRQPRNYFLMNLAVTDLGLLLTNNFLHVIASFNKQWPFGERGCTFYALCGGICGLTSIATMTAIGLTRLIVVIDPFSSLKLTGHFTLKCIVCSWIYGSIWIIPPLFGWSRFIFEGFGTTCTFDYVSTNMSNRLFILALVTGGFLIPLTLIIISYTAILLKLSKRDHHLVSQKDEQQQYQYQPNEPNISYFKSVNSVNNDFSQNQLVTIVPTDRNQTFRKTHRTEARATRTAILVCATFCMAWTPYALMAILSQIGLNHFINVYTTALLGLLTKTAACVNPWIYAFSSVTFREHLFHHGRLSHQHITFSEYSSNRRNPLVKN